MLIRYGIEAAVPAAGITKTLTEPQVFLDANHYTVGITKAIAAGIPCDVTVTKTDGSHFTLVPTLAFANIEWIAYGDDGAAIGPSYDDYLAELESILQDTIPKLATADRQRAIAMAVNEHGRDAKFALMVELDGNGTQLYDVSLFGSLWVYGESSIRSVEYPAGNNPRSMLDADEWELYDDGTAQDGSNLVLRLRDYTPAATEHLNVEVVPPFILPFAGAPNYPNTTSNMQRIVMLAAVHCFTRLAAAYAPSSDATITADSVNHHDKTGRYLQLAKQYQRWYNKLVFGSEDPSTLRLAAEKVIELTPPASSGGAFLFHGRS